MTKVVNGQRNLIADHASDIVHVLTKIINALLSDLNAGERMHDIATVQCVRETDDRVGDTAQVIDPQVHLEELETLIHAFLQPLPHCLTVRFGMRVAVDEDLVAELTARKHVGGHPIGPSCKIHQGHLNGTYAPRLTRMVAKLLDLAKDLVHVAGVLPKNAALEHQCIGATSAISHLTVTRDTLIGIDPDQGTIHGNPFEVHHAHVGDFQLRRTRVLIDILLADLNHVCIAPVIRDWCDGRAARAITTR